MFRSSPTHWQRGVHQETCIPRLKTAARPAAETSYLLTAWSRMFLEKLTVSQPVKEIIAFYRTRTFITAFITARQLSIFWAISIQPIPPHHTSRISILILSSHYAVISWSLSRRQGPSLCSKWRNDLRYGG